MNISSNVIVDTPNGLTGSCGGGSITTTTTSVALSGATLLAGESCSFSVDVEGIAIGAIENTVNVTSDQGAGNTSTANMRTNEPTPALGFLKQIGSTATGPWANSLLVAPDADVYYRFTVENTGDVDMKLFWVFMPPGLEHWFRAIGRRRDGQARMPDAFDRPDNVQEIMEQMRFVPPAGR